MDATNFTRLNCYLSASNNHFTNCVTLPLDQRHLPLSQAFDELEAMSKKSKDLPLPLYPIQEVPSLPNLPSLDSECCSEVKNNFNEKKVDFLDIVQYSDPPTDSFDDDPTQPEKLPMLPPPNLRPQKGILKFSHGYIHPSLSSLLESCLKALGGSDVFSRRDAYINLSNILRGYDNVLDSLSLKSRLHQLCQYIERDLSASDDDRDPTSSLVPPALTLINSLQFNSTVIDDLPIKFRIFVVEYAIKALEDPLIPRDIIRNIMFVVANQNFSPKVMTSERFGRLVKALHIVEENDKRKRIITGRIEIFQNLLKNSKSLMAIHTVWIENLLCDMNSSLKDIQLSAIKFGFEAAVKLGTEYSVSGTLCALLKSKFKNGELYGTVYTQTLMKKSKQENGKLVPQIWSILILFQRHRPQILAESSFLKPLLAVLTNCLSQRSSIIQKEALYAWNRFIFSVQLSDKTPKSLREILIRPYIHSLSHQRAFHVLPSMFNLLYYAFRPGCSSTQLDIYWDEFVKVLISQSLPRRKNDEKSRKNVDLVIQILVNLFDVNRSRIWNENKAVESIGENQVTADELPALDSKWLRKNSSRVFPVLLSVLELLFWDFADPSSLATKVWENYISSIASPAAMEVIVSKETMSFIIGVLGFLYQHWDKGVNDSQISPPSGGAQVAHTYLQSFQTIISITVSGLGVHAFMEKLSKFSQDNLLPVANEYQQLLEKTPNKSPIQHIVNLFTRPCSGIEYDQHYIQLIDYVLKPFLEIRKSPASKLAFLAELGIFPSASANLTPSKMIWEVFANHVVNAISSPDLNRDSMNGCLSLDSYACVVKFLEHGINLSPDQPMPGWCSLFEVILSSATIQAGYSGRALAVIEPLSMVLCITPYGKSYIDLLISNAGYPKDQEELQLAQEIPWSLENPKPVITSLDPYFHLYEYLNFSIISSYKSNDQNSKVISSTNTLLRRCPIELVLSVLCRIKDAISLWIIDEDLNLTGGVQEESVVLLWSTIITILNQLMATSIQSRVLSNLESLIYSGIQSKNLRIAEMTVQTCTSILSDKDDVLKNFERLKSSLHSLGQSASQSSCSLLPDLCAKNESKETCPPECSANDCGNTENLRYMTPQSQQELQAPVSDLKKEQLSTPQVVIKINNSSKACGENKSKNSNFKSNKKAVLLETCDIALDNSLASESPLIIACSSGSQVLKDMCQSDEHEMGSISDSGICSKLYFDPELPANAIAAPNNEISNSKFQSTPVASDKNSPVPESFSLISLTHENNKDIDPLLCYKEKGLEISSVDSFSISKAPISQSQFSLQNINLNFFKNIEKQPNLDCTMQDFICTVQNPQEMSTQDSTISHEIRKFKCKNSFHELSNNSDSVTARLLTSPKETRSQNMVTPETASTSGRPSNENSIDYKCNTLDQPVIETPIGNEHEDTTNDGQCTHNSSVLEDEALGIKINLLHVGTHLKKNMNDSVAEIEKSNELNIDEVQNIHSKDCAPCHDPKTLKVSNDLEHSLYVDTTKSDFSILPPLPNKLKTNAESTVLGKDSSYELTASLPVGEDSKALCSPTAEDRPNKKNLKSLGKRSCVSSPVKRPCRKSAREIPQKSTYRSCRNTLNSSEKDKKKMIHDGLDNLVRSPKPNDISVSPSSNISTRLRSNLRSNVRKRKACKDDETQFTRNQSNPLHSEQIGLKRRRVTRSSLTKDVVNKIYNQNVSVELDMPEFSTNNKPSINNLSNVAKSDNEKNNGEAAMEGSMINLKRKIIHEIGVKQISLVDFESPESIQEDSGSLVLTDEHPNEKNISHNKTIINAPIDGQSWPTNTIENQYKNINAKENTVGIEEQHEILYSDKSNFKSSAMNFLIRNSSTNLSSPNGSSTAKAVDAMQSEDMCKDIFESINFLITALQKSKLCKNVVGLIEDKMMDAKRELYEAERRGRSSH